MPFRHNVFALGNYYHIYNRGINKQNIFFTQENYLYFLKLLRKYSESWQVAVIAYCLMPNHYHLLLRQDSDISLSRFMNVLFSTYVQALNKQLARKGPLFEGRFKHIHVDNDEYILHLCRYIHLNPVNAGLVTTPVKWLFSNYREWIGQRQGKLKDTNFISTYFTSPEEYEKFVIDYNIDIDLRRRLEPYLLE